MTQNKVIPLDKIKVACGNCSLIDLCLPLGLESKEVDKLDSIVKRDRPLHSGDYLYQPGEPFKHIFVIKSGTVKTFSRRPDGSEQVLSFHLPGEIVGMEGVEQNSHCFYAQAMETTAVCKVPFKQLEALAAELPNLQHQVFSLMSKEINRDTDLMLLLGKSSAEERLAAFLLSLSTRYKQRGFSHKAFILSMSRQDIGNYLGLAIETVSRLFTQFQKQGIINVQRKNIEIVDFDKLKSLLSNHLACLHRIKA
ncbi:MAG: fumarate/nitrate reduction transcriptional regulator Fnr [bacterium]